MIKYQKGDLLQAIETIIAHGVNCSGGFGSGVAGQIAKKYPKARYYYLDKFEEEGWKLGDVEFVPQWNQKFIANCATQDKYLPRGTCHADYEAIRTCMTKVKNFAEMASYSIAIPKIGAGLAGGDWGIIEKILNEVFSDYDVTVYEL